MGGWKDGRTGQQYILRHADPDRHERLRLPGEDFLFCLKASRRITHDHRLLDTASLMEFLLQNLSVLGPKRGPTLFQMPPNLKKDIPRLREFLALVPKRRRAAFEWRHPSWFDEEVYDILSAHGAALVTAGPAIGLRFRELAES